MREEGRIRTGKARRALVSRRVVVTIVIRLQLEATGFGRDGRLLPLLAILLDPAAVHADSTLRADTSTQVVVLVADATDHTRATWVPWPQGQAVKVGHSPVKICLRAKINKGTGRPRD